MRCVLMGLVLVACGDNRVAPDASAIDADSVDAPEDAAPFCGNGIVDPGEECDRGLRGLSHDGCTSTCRDEHLTFSAPTRENMMFRAGHALTYDAARDRVVMFGGGDFAASGETWEYNGTEWELLVPVVHPSARYEPAMFYENNRSILFGGVGLFDTWAWDGATWSPLSVTTTPTGSIAGAAFDRQRNVGVLVTADGTWEWNGTDWRLAGLSPSTSERVVSYAGAGRIALIGADDISFWNGTSWSTVATESWGRPIAATFDPTGRLIATAFDRFATTYATLVYEWTGTAWMLLPSVGDAPRARKTPIAFDENDDAIVMFGGEAGSDGNDTWTWEGTWQQRYESVPPPRILPTMEYDTLRGSVLMFGGAGQSSLRNDTWISRRGVWSELAVTAAPEARVNWAAAFDEDRGVLVMYGGQVTYVPTSFDKVADLWELDGTTWTRRIAPTAIPQDSPVTTRATYDQANHYTLIVTPQQTLTWDGANLIERTPPPVTVSSLQYDAKRGVAVLTDGEHVYEWTGAIWASHGVQSVAGPMVYDPNRGTMLIPTIEDGLWEWNGSTTSQLMTQTPPSWAQSPPRYDRSSQRFTSFGAPSGWDTLVFRWEGAEIDERCDGTDADLDGLVRCDDPDCWWRCTPRCPPYASCDPAAPRCGDGTCSELEDTALCPADCT